MQTNGESGIRIQRAAISSTSRKFAGSIELMNEHDLAEIDLRQGDQRIRLQRGGEPLVTGGVVRLRSRRRRTRGQSTAAPTAAEPAGRRQSGRDQEPDGRHVLRCRRVPSRRRSSKSAITSGPTPTVCIIEAMKVFNEIPAECPARSSAVLVENGDAGRIRPAAVQDRHAASELFSVPVSAVSG